MLYLHAMFSITSTPSVFVLLWRFPRSPSALAFDVMVNGSSCRGPTRMGRVVRHTFNFPNVVSCTSVHLLQISVVSRLFLAGPPPPPPFLSLGLPL